ncbi:N-acetylneuraminate synthase family protein [Citrifermentans bemidjiense Bem]|uniref:N-acetylneuraminate synthase family protein n=1 Tax=Citrifermentans bemidjiense (strain ATCC BAA-1014 / DSM 16622 / JCM 12645 / Bem) TaxID=404380 RepID=B5EDU0_CITBB|nr:N-acetylneuraminate synthase family protein [Citrifermentans bemidjiense]ACH40718.1 N-acetylneuraminate synthase family protein [Citrifermentans bemidjiense Bem]
MKLSFAPRQPIYIIAEIGGNFTTFEEAKALVDAAASCGVDAVKLQTYRAETVSSKSAIFDMENTGIASQFELFQKYEIDEELHRQVFDYIRAKGLDWFSTPSHEADVDLLDRLGVSAYKIGSDDAVNIPFLRYVAAKGKPVLLATGMCTMQEVRESVDVILGAGNLELILLHAVTSYPTHPEHVNLLAMQALAREFNLPVGYSDHTIGTVACLGAAALGAAVLEKHFTTDKNAEGPDHILSADPAEMRTIVEQVRTLEAMMGSGVKMPAASEKTTRINNRKSIVAARALPAGHRLTAEDIAVKRPGFGIPPRFREELPGSVLNEPVEQDEVIPWSKLR